MMELTPSIRQSLRRKVGRTHTGIPVTIVRGDHAPQLIGEDGGWFTTGGTPIRHPSAYSRKGWSNMRYHRSSLEVIVGQQWLNKNLIVR